MGTHSIKKFIEEDKQEVNSNTFIVGGWDVQENSYHFLFRDAPLFKDRSG